MPAPLPVTRKEAIAKICRAIEDVRLSRAATQHAIEQSRKSMNETHALLIALRLKLLGSSLPRVPGSIAVRVASERRSDLNRLRSLEAAKAR
jgi:hypothetical protein